MFQGCHTADTAITGFGHDCDHSNQVTADDKSRPFLSSVVADDSMVCTVAMLMFPRY